MGVETDREFSLYPWIGTGVHSYLETSTFPEAEHELKLYCGEVPGYGAIKGTTDIYFPEEGVIGDWKIVGLKKIKQYRTKGVPQQYRYQAMIYGAGCVLAGKVVESIAIIFIPRDSGNVNDIYVYEEEFQPEMAEAAFARAGMVYELAKNGDWDQLPSDDDCYNCNYGGW